MKIVMSDCLYYKYSLGTELMTLVAEFMPIRESSMTVSDILYQLEKLQVDKHSNYQLWHLGVDLTKVLWHQFTQTCLASAKTFYNVDARWERSIRWIRFPARPSSSRRRRSSSCRIEFLLQRRFFRRFRRRRHRFLWRRQERRLPFHCRIFRGDFFENKLACFFDVEYTYYPSLRWQHSGTPIYSRSQVRVFKFSYRWHWE
jgi:hypothetical protein